MSKLPSSMVKDILESMYPHRKELAPCFIGAPGIGKTQGIYEFAKEKGVNVVTFILSNTVPSEVSGMRMPDKDSKKMEVFDDMRMRSLKDGDILFFDEILEAPPMLWSSVLTLIQDRIMASGRELPDVFIVAASNPVASPAIIPASVRNRFQFIELEFDADSWIQWFKDRYNLNPRSLVNRIQDDSDQYNIFTPREAAKMYEYLSDGISDIKAKVIGHMFDSFIYNKLSDLVKGKSGQRQIIEALGDAGIYVKAMDNAGIYTGIYVPAELLNMSMEELYEILHNSDNWNEIEEVLKNIEYTEEEDDFIPY